jgi:hypothetical protein
MIDDVSMTWFRLRERRASLRSRSRLSDSAGRRQTFAAAMQQFEEQFASAKVVTAEEANGGPPQATVFFDADMPEGDHDAWMKRFGEMMAACPTAAGWAIPMRQGAVGKPQEAGQRWAVTVGWPYESPTAEMSPQDLKAFFGKMAPEYLYRSDRYLRPGVGADARVPPSPLMTWWLLLYSFSILARYEPRRWAQLLDLDSSGAAVLIEYALNEALTVVPHLVLEALDQSLLLLAKPLAL